MDTKKEIPMPVVLGIALLALLVVVGGGIWFLNRPTGPTAEESANYLKGDQEQLQRRAAPATQGR